ncbi:cell division protein ZapA [Psychrobacter sp. I-STPA10]|uniref:cell division protein ZapA n=1 Tax=Psychrobacter sp. I-STPA10 TaxID=2585769 RepID=UPI001E442B95|nr:cell division protein ZapA [Psychrobacter sp. I-STPA10]
MKKVDISISGKTYSINCPEEEVDKLNAASDYVNDFIQNLHQQAPKLSHENLLVLCCLNLYEKIHTQENLDKSSAMDNKQTEELLDKIINDANSML